MKDYLIKFHKNRLDEDPVVEFFKANGHEDAVCCAENNFWEITNEPDVALVMLHEGYGDKLLLAALINLDGELVRLFSDRYIELDEARRKHEAD